MKKIIKCFALIAMICSITTVVEAAHGIIDNGTTYVPVRGVFEELGFEVSWNQQAESATLANADYTIVIPKNTNNFIVNNRTVIPQSPQKIISGSLYLPLRAIGDAVGAATSWDSNSKTAHISYNGKDVYVSCVNDSSNNNSLQSKNSSYTGVIMNFYDGNKYILLPLESLCELGVINNKNYQTWTGNNYKIEVLHLDGYIRIYDINSNYNVLSGLVYTLTYDEQYYSDMESLCTVLGITYSYDSANNVAHLNFNNKNVYIKCYPKINLYGAYPENNSVSVVSNRPTDIKHGETLSDATYTYSYSKKEFDTLKEDALDFASCLVNAGFELTKSETKDNGFANFYTKGTGKNAEGVTFSIMLYGDNYVFTVFLY